MVECEIGLGKRKYEEVQEEGSGPKVQESQGSRVLRSRGPKDQNISKSHSNTNLTLKKVHLVHFISLKSSLQEDTMSITEKATQTAPAPPILY